MVTDAEIRAAGAAPVCACDDLLRRMWADKGIEVHVQPWPDVVVEVVGGFAPSLMRCPHGNHWMAEPTGEQRLAWAIAGTA